MPPTRATDSVRFVSLLILPGFSGRSVPSVPAAPIVVAGSIWGRPPVGSDSFCAEQCRTRQIDEFPTGTNDSALHRLHAHSLMGYDLGVTELCIFAQHDSDPKLFGEKEKGSTDRITVDRASRREVFPRMRIRPRPGRRGPRHVVCARRRAPHCSRCDTATFRMLLCHGTCRDSSTPRSVHPAVNSASFIEPPDHPEQSHCPACTFEALLDGRGSYEYAVVRRGRRRRG